jgi:hypothetical protein
MICLSRWCFRRTKMRIYAKKSNRMLRIPIKRTIFAEQKCIFTQKVKQYGNKT